MRRHPAALLISLAAVAVGSLVVAGPAHAADRTVRLQFAFPDAHTAFALVPCEEEDPTQAGTGTYRLSGQTSEPRSMSVAGFPVGTAAGFTHAGSSLVGEPVVRYARYAATGGESVTRFEFTEAGSHTTWRAQFRSVSGPGWQVVDPMAAGYYWVERDAVGQPTGRTASGTPAGLRAARGLADGAYRVSVGFGCDGETVLFDRIAYGAEGHLTTLDFEAYPSVVAASPSRGVAAGQSTTLTTRVEAIDEVTQAATGVRGGQLSLQRASGTDFVDVATITGSTTSDDYTATLTPTATATYRWSYAGDAAHEPAVSAPFTVTVTPPVATAPAAPATGRTLVAAPSKTKVKRGKRIVVQGQLTPADPGATVTLWRERAGADLALGTAVVALDGRFRLDATATRRGRLVLYVTGPSATTSSPFTVKVTVRRR